MVISNKHMWNFLQEKLRKSFTFLMSKCLKLRKFILVFLLIINFLIFFQKFRGNLKVLGNKHIESIFRKEGIKKKMKKLYNQE